MNDEDAGVLDAGNGDAPVCDHPSGWEECIHGPECWQDDAVADGVICERDEDCPSGTCDPGAGRCRCENDDECNDGVCGYGGICGPSWCNGYYLCSLWGPYCFFDDGGPKACEREGEACLEGDYPSCPNYGASGYCE